MDKSISISHRHVDRVLSLLLVLFCGYLFMAVRDFSPYGAVFPKYINMALSVLAVIYFLKSWIPMFLKKDDGRETGRYLFIDDYPSFLIAFPLTVIYIFVLLSGIGFLTSSIIYTISVIFLIKKFRGELDLRNFVVYLFFSLVFSALVYYIFRYLLSIRLPRGMFI